MISTPGCKHNKIWNTCEECRPNLVDPSGLFEKLAAIEHERWADWQRYVHSKMTPSADDGIWLIGEAFIDRWERQIRTPYAELTEEEKESDRNQVRRYWDLITVPNGRNKESAEPKYISRIDPDGVRRVYDLEGKALDTEAVRDERNEESADCKCCGWEGGSLIKNNYCKECSKSIQAERTRIIKALEGLKKELGRGVDELGRPESPAVIIQIAERRGFNSALDQAIKAVEEKE